MTMELHTNKMRLDPTLMKLAKVRELLMILPVSFTFSLFHYCCYFFFFLFHVKAIFNILFKIDLRFFLHVINELGLLYPDLLPFHFPLLIFLLFCCTYC